MTNAIHGTGATMRQSEQFRLRLRELFSEQNLAALATHQAGQPYANLIAFQASDDLRYLYFVTPKTTRKFANLTADNRVAVMVNNSLNRDSDFHRAISVTAVGRATEVQGVDKEAALVNYLKKHGHLEDFANAPTSALIRVAVETYYMVTNFQTVTELHLAL